MMKRKQVLFVTNVSAGKREAEQMLYPIISTLAVNNCEVTVYPVIPDQGLTSVPILCSGFELDFPKEGSATEDASGAKEGSVTESSSVGKGSSAAEGNSGKNESSDGEDASAGKGGSAAEDASVKNESSDGEDASAGKDGSAAEGNSGKAGDTAAGVAASVKAVGQKEWNRLPYRFDVILVCGGDGTLNHVINTLIKLGLNTRIPIGYIPSGSTNDFSKNLNGDLSTEEICKAVAGNHSFAYDIGFLHEENQKEGRYFNYVAGFGAFTKISYSTRQSFKNVFGYSAYILQMIATLPQNMAYKQHVVVEHDGEREEDDYIFGGMTNSLSLAGVESPILGNAELNDGLFEVLLIKAPADLIEINEIISTLSRGSTNNQYVKVIHTSHVAFHCDEALDWTIDGEYGGSYRDACIDVLPQAVKIMVK